jgi:predicted Zn-dependent protease
MVIMTTAREIQVGSEEAKKIEEQAGLVTDHPAVGYMHAIGERLAEHSPRKDVPYSFQVVDMVEPNAFALPGGHVYVSRGLLAFANSEAELANVIGHEIGHVAARHAVQRVTRAAPLAIATGLPALAVGILSPRLGRTVAGVGGLAGTALLAPYSRSQENEADGIGQKMAAAAGWDPGGMPSFLDTLGREEALSGGSKTPAFLRSHPSTPKRVAKTRELAAKLTAVASAPIAATDAAFLQRLDGLIVGENPSSGVFEGQRFLHPDMDFTVLFPEGWKTQNVASFVRAQAPEGAAFAGLEIQGAGEDALEAAESFAAEQKIKLTEGPEAIEIGELPAARGMALLQSRRGELLLDLTWIVHNGTVFRMMGATGPKRADTFRPVFHEVAGSFRPLTLSERQGIQVIRLRIMTARRGETLEELLARANAVANAERTAVANGISADTPLEEGQLVKVAVWKLYTPPER